MRRRAGHRPRRVAERARRGLDALHVLAPLIDALVEASACPPLTAAGILRRAVEEALGWRATMVGRMETGAPERPYLLDRRSALVPIAPGAGALRVTGGDEPTLRRAAALCALALARARENALEGARGEPPSRRRIVVAEADPDGRESLRHLLEPEFQVVSAADGPSALAAVRAEGPAGVLLGAGLSSASTLETLERLRADPPAEDLPVLLLADGHDEATQVRALEMGASLHPGRAARRPLHAHLDRVLRLARAHRVLRHEALTDALTGLPNRRALWARLTEEVVRARRYRTPLACVMVDLDGLKPINDALGHAAGDRALAGLAGVLRTELRESDFAARVGGDEFVALLPHTSASEASVLAERVSRRMGAIRLRSDAPGPAVRASFGIASFAEPQAAEDLLAAADRALYAVKRATARAARRSTTPRSKAAAR